MFTLLMCGLHQAEYDAQFYWEDTTQSFTDIFRLFFLAAVVAVPLAFGLLRWKNRATPNLAVLGLDGRPSRYLRLGEPGRSRLLVVLYLLTGMLTFEFGVLVFDAVQALK